MRRSRAQSWPSPEQSHAAALSLSSVPMSLTLSSTAPRGFASLPALPRPMLSCAPLLLASPARSFGAEHCHLLSVADRTHSLFRQPAHATADDVREDTMEDAQSEVDLPVFSDIISCLAYVQRGAQLLKYGRRGSPHTRFFYVDDSGSFLQWWSQKKKKEDSMVAFSDVCRLQIGQATPVFSRFRKQRTRELKQRSFSLIYGKDRSLDLVCFSKEDFLLWVRALRFLISRRRRSIRENPYRGLLRSHWDLALVREKGVIDVRAMSRLLKGMNCTLDRKALKLVFESAGLDRHTVIDGLDFYRIMSKLTTPAVVEQLFDVYSSDSSADTCFSVCQKEFHDFLVREQKMKISEAEAVSLMKKITGGRTCLQRDEFIRFILSESNSLIEPSTASLYQNMDLPICDYFISSSHNTYLEGDQLKGPSSVKMYCKALRQGCRCVELDCWDGPNGEPIIYHGFTLTSKLKFRDVIEAVRDNAFCQNPYPVILSFENHCSKPFQKRMAEHLVAILGDLLAVPSEFPNLTELPSPNRLKYRIILKVKIPEKNRDSRRSISAPNIGSDSLGNLLKGAAEMPKADEDTCVREEGSTDDEFRVTKKLASLVLLPARKFLAFDEPRFAKCVEMSSFSEKKLAKICKKSRDAFIEHNRRHLSRVYPSKFRVDSSNLQPFTAWDVGCQMVALNLQTLDLPMLFNHAKFSENGSCGYVLQPGHLRSSHQQQHRPEPLPFVRLLITVIAAFHLPLNEGEVINSYARIIVRGGSSDVFDRKTSVIFGNGMYPCWNEGFELNVSASSILSIQVLDRVKFSEDRVIGQGALTVNRLRRGYRFLPLLDNKFEPIPFGGVLVHVRALS